MASTQSVTTADQLLQAPGLGRCELVQGELVMMTPAGYEHGRVIGRLAWRLGGFVEQNELGEVSGAETGFQIRHAPDTVRAPDLAFVRAQRLPRSSLLGYFQGAPDLAVEVLSPHDRATEVLSKVYDWLDAGCRAVWVIDPQTRTVTVYHSRERIVALRDMDVLRDEELIPGFSVAVSDVFPS